MNTHKKQPHECAAVLVYTLSENLHQFGHGLYDLGEVLNGLIQSLEIDGVEIAHCLLQAFLGGDDQRFHIVDHAGEVHDGKLGSGGFQIAQNDLHLGNDGVNLGKYSGNLRQNIVYKAYSAGAAQCGYQGENTYKTGQFYLLTVGFFDFLQQFQ